MSHAEYLRQLNTGTIASVSYYRLSQAADALDLLTEISEDLLRHRHLLPTRLLQKAEEALETKNG